MKFGLLAFLSVAAASASSTPDVVGDVSNRDLSQCVTELNFDDSTVSVNTLQKEDGELRYDNVGLFENEPLDLVVTVSSGDYTDIKKVWKKREKKNRNGKEKEEGKIGRINLQTVKNKPKSGEGNFEFCFVKTGTVEPVTLPRFTFTAFDLDDRGKNTKLGQSIREKVIIDTSQVESFFLTETTEVKLQCENRTPYSGTCDGARTVFRSSRPGGGEDNPIDPNNLTQDQRDRTVEFTFKDKACFELTFDHFCPADQDYWKKESFGKCKRYNGGFLLFSTATDPTIIDGECEFLGNEIIERPTSIPTASPTSTPTLSPTGSPTGGPTSSPTASPTGSPSALSTTTGSGQLTLPLFCVDTEGEFPFKNGETTCDDIRAKSDSKITKNCLIDEVEENCPTLCLDECKADLPPTQAPTSQTSTATSTATSSATSTASSTATSSVSSVQETQATTRQPGP